MNPKPIKIPNIQTNPSESNSSSSQTQQQQQHRDNYVYPETPLSPRLGPTRSSIEARRRERERERERERISLDEIERAPSNSPRPQTSRSALSYRYGSPDDFPEMMKSAAEPGYSGTFGRSQASLLSSNSPGGRSTPILQSTLNQGRSSSSRPNSGGIMGEEGADLRGLGIVRSSNDKGKAREIDAESYPIVSKKPLSQEDQQLLDASSAALAYSRQAELDEQPRELEAGGDPVSSLDPRSHWLGGPESPPQEEVSRNLSSKQEERIPGGHFHEASAESQRTFGGEALVGSSRPRSRDSLPRLQTASQPMAASQEETSAPSQTPTSTEQTPISSEAPSENQIPSTPPRNLQSSSSQERNLNPVSNLQNNRNGSRQVSSQAPTISSTQASPARTRTGVGERGGLTDLGGALKRTLSPDQERERLEAIRRKEEVEFERRRNADFTLHRSDTWKEGASDGKSKEMVGESRTSQVEGGLPAGTGEQKQPHKSKKGKRRLFGLKRTASDATPDSTTASNLTAGAIQDTTQPSGSSTTPPNPLYLSAVPLNPTPLTPQDASPTDVAFPKRSSSLRTAPPDSSSITRSRSQSVPLEPEPVLLQKSRQRLSFVNVPSGSFKEYSADSDRRVRPSSISFPATFSPRSHEIASEATFRRLERDPSTSNANSRDLVEELQLSSGANRGNRRSGSRGRGISTPSGTPKLQRMSQIASDPHASLHPGSSQFLAGEDQELGEVDEAFGLGLGLPIRYSFPVSEQSAANLASGRPSLSTLLAHRTRSLARYHLSSLSSLRPRFPPNPNQVLRPIRFNHKFFARMHYFFLPLITYYHVPATIFLDYNALYTLAQLAVYGNGMEGNDTVGWYVALAVYAACDLIWFFGIVVGVEGIRFLTRSWANARPYILPIYLSSNTFNLTAIKSYTLYSFLYKVRLRATPRDRWIETCWFWSQNWPTVLSLLPRGIVSVAVLVLFGPSASDVSVVEGRDSTYFNSEDGYLTDFIYIILLINVGWTAWRLVLLVFSFLGLVGTLGFKEGLSREKGVGYEKFEPEEEEVNQQVGYPSAAISNQSSRFPLMRPSQDVGASPGTWDEGHATVGALVEEDSNPQLGRTSRVSLSGGTTYPPTFTPVRSRPVSGAFVAPLSSPARAWRQRAEDRIREVLFECMPHQSLDYSLSRINQSQLDRDSREVLGTPRPSSDQRNLTKVTEETSRQKPQGIESSLIADPRSTAHTNDDSPAAVADRNRTRTGDTDLETVGDWNRSRRSRATSSPASPTLEQRMKHSQTSNKKQINAFDREDDPDLLASPAESSAVEMLSTPVNGSPQVTERAILPNESGVASSSTPIVSEGHRSQGSDVSVGSSRKSLVYPFPSRSIASSPPLSAERSSSEGRFSSDRERQSSTLQRHSGESGSKRNSRSLDPNSSVERLTARGSKTHSREASAGSAVALANQNESGQSLNPQNLPVPGEESKRKNSHSGSEKPSSSLTSLASSLKGTITRSNKTSSNDRPSSIELLTSQSTPAPPSESRDDNIERPHDTIAERRHQSNGGAVGSSQSESLKLQGSDDWWKSFKGAFRSRSDSNPSSIGKQESVTPMQETKPTTADMSRTSTATPSKVASPGDTDELQGIDLNDQDSSSESLEVPQSQPSYLIPPSDLNLARTGASDAQPPSPGALSVASEATADSATTGSTDDSEERRLWASFPEQSRIHPPGRIVVDLEQKTLAARERARIDAAASAPTSSTSSSGPMNIVLPSKSSLSSSPAVASPTELSGALAPSLPTELSRSPSEGGLIPIKEESWSSSHGDSLSTQSSQSSPNRNRR